jgi:hypothetical protein
MDDDSSHYIQPQLDGTITFTCCGSNHSHVGNHLTRVVCPYCHTSYDIQLQARVPAPHKYPPGTTVRTTREILSRAGSNLVKLQKGEVLTVASDLHSVLGTLEAETLVELPFPTPDQPRRGLLAPVPNDSIETHPETPNPQIDTIEPSKTEDL